jgi:23S rRNA (pseudouridine1915-N3)-methyltransferase
MMKVDLICVGKLRESYWRDACAEYAKRLGRFCRFSVVEIPEVRLPENPSEAQIHAALEAEGEKLLAAAQGSKMTALCIEGKSVSSEELAQQIGRAGLDGAGRLSFLIGSSFGLGENVKRRADYRLSMSAMTFPHQLARVMLCEQIYRAFEIVNRGKYHK